MDSTTTDATVSIPVFRLIYRSRMRIPTEKRKAELGAIFSTARSKNKRWDVTGALLIWEDFFVQVLEGEEPDVRALFDTIHDDPRHERVVLLETVPAVERVFSRWSMARVGDDDEPDIPLLMNRDKGGISRAADRPATSAQQEVLDTMRHYARAAAVEPA